jgi:hypothetical protein
MANKTFKVGTILSFKKFAEDTYDNIGLIVSEREISKFDNHYEYLIHTIYDQEFWMRGWHLKHEIDLEEWKIEYEPE